MEGFKLRKGAEILVRSLSSKDEVLETQGIYQGNTMIGQGSALIVKLPGRKVKGKENIRLLPEHMLLSIDVIKNGQLKEKGDKDKGKYPTNYA